MKLTLEVLKNIIDSMITEQLGAWDGDWREQGGGIDDYEAYAYRSDEDTYYRAHSLAKDYCNGLKEKGEINSQEEWKEEYEKAYERALDLLADPDAPGGDPYSREFKL